MNIVDLILSEPEQANSAVAASLQARVFDYLDNYQLAEESIDEATNTVTKDKNGKITGWKHEGDWKKSKPTTDKQAMSKVKADTEGARKWSEQLTKEDLDEESKMSQQQWEDNRAHKATAAARKDVAARDPETERRRKQMELLFPDTKTSGRLTKEDLDEEQLDELSKATLGSYIKKANTSKDKAMNAVDSDEVSDKEWAKGVNTVSKRKDGINKAGSKFISK